MEIKKNIERRSDSQRQTKKFPKIAFSVQIEKQLVPSKTVKMYKAQSQSSNWRTGVPIGITV